MIAVFDLGGPLGMYVLLRSAIGLSTVLSLVLSGILPAFGVAITAIQFRKMDLFGVMVLAGIVMGSILGLTTHDPRLYLAEGSVPSAVFAVACLASLRTQQPLIYRIALEFVGPDSKRGREIADAWPSPVFRRAFRVITIAWGVGYLLEAGLRMVVAETTSTGIALICSKGAPYVFATALAAWTLAYGERKRKASTTVSSDIPYREPAAALTPADEQTLLGCPLVTLQSAAVIMLAAPSMSFATVLDGLCRSAAICDQVRPSRSDGMYCVCGTMYRLAMSTNGIELPLYSLNSASSCAVGCSRYTWPNGVLASAASPYHSTGVNAT
jgi:hypothetical protein